MDTPVMQPPVVPSVPLLSYAGFWRRLIAWFIDNLILSAATMIILIPFLPGPARYSLWLPGGEQEIARLHLFSANNSPEICLRFSTTKD